MIKLQGSYLCDFKIIQEELNRGKLWEQSHEKGALGRVRQEVIDCMKEAGCYTLHQIELAFRRSVPEQQGLWDTFKQKLKIVYEESKTSDEKDRQAEVY